MYLKVFLLKLETFYSIYLWYVNTSVFYVIFKHQHFFDSSIWNQYMPFIQNCSIYVEKYYSMAKNIWSNMLLAIKNRVVCLCIIQVHRIVHLYVYIHNMVKTIANMANITLLWFIFGQKCAIISKINLIDFTKFFNVEKYHFCF